MTSCCKTFFKILAVFLAIVDIGVGWFTFYQWFEEIPGLTYVPECRDPSLYWKIYVPFEAIGTILGFFEIYYLIKEINKDKSLFDQCFSRAWFLVVAIYIFAAFPSSILAIIYRDRCVCSDGFSVTVWESELSDFVKGFTGGASVICLQILIHFAEVYRRLRRFWELITGYVFCMKTAPDCENDCEKPVICFIISIILAVGYTALYVTEIIFIFCVRY